MPYLAVTMGGRVRVLIFLLAISLATCGYGLPLPPHFLLLDILNKMPAMNQDMMVPRLGEELYEEPSTSRIIQDIMAEIRRKEIQGQNWGSLVRVL